MSSVRSPRPVSPTIVGGPPATVNASAAIPPRCFARSKTIRAVSGMPMPCAETVGWRMRTLSSSMYSRSRARTYVSNCVKLVTVGRVSSGRNGRRSGLAFAELAPGRVRGHLDPPLLAEIVDDPVEVLDGFALVHLCARDHVHAVTAVRRKGRSRTARRRSEEHTSELQSQSNLVCRLLLEKKKTRELPFAYPARAMTEARERKPVRACHLQAVRPRASHVRCRYVSNHAS